MLQEVLLCLAGHPSPLLSGSSATQPTGANATSNAIDSLLTPAEKSLLKSLAEDLGDKHRQVRALATRIAASARSSTVCRAVAAAILSTHLARFQEKILQVESDILRKSPNLVGAKNIVPLSAVVTAFDGWPRRLQWLWKVVQFIESPSSSLEKGKRTSEGSVDSPGCTGSQLIQLLRDEAYTGYTDIKELNYELTQTAETAWLKQLAGWVLYGRHPGGLDFFVTPSSGVDDESAQSYSWSAYQVSTHLVPCFVSPETANSILFIGMSLHHIKSRDSFQPGARDLAAPNMSLVTSHLSCLSALKPPIAASDFSAAIHTIRRSLAQNTLQRLLPATKISEILRVLKDFFLLGRGEFATALISAADQRLSSRHQPSKPKTSEINDGLASLTIRDGEVQAVLARTWAALSSNATFDDDEEVDEDLDFARDLITFSIKGVETATWGDNNSKVATPAFDDLLLPCATILSIQIASPLDLFLTKQDIEAYSSINAYLLALRRAHFHLSHLVQLSVLRRDFPSPRASSYVREKDPFNGLAQRRERENRREKTMRPIWAAIGQASTFFAEFGAYLHGEVIQNCWEAFTAWLQANMEESSRPGSRDRPVSSSTSSGHSVSGSRAPADPELLASAHRTYLQALRRSILVDDAGFTSTLRQHLTIVDHACALFSRLDMVQQRVESEQLSAADAGQSSSHYAAEEERLVRDLKNSQQRLQQGTSSLIKRLRDIDGSWAKGDETNFKINHVAEEAFKPWTAQRLDELLLKLDFNSGQQFILPPLFDS